MSIEQLPNGSFEVGAPRDSQPALPAAADAPQAITARPDLRLRVHVQLPQQRRPPELPGGDSGDISPEDAASFAASHDGVSIEDIDAMDDEQFRKFLRRGAQTSSSRPAVATRADIVQRVGVGQQWHGRHESEAVASSSVAGANSGRHKHAAVVAGSSTDEPGESPPQPEPLPAEAAKALSRRSLGQVAAAAALAATVKFRSWREKAGRFFGKVNAKTSNAMTATQEYFGDKEKGQRRKWVAAGVGALAVATAVAIYAVTRDTSHTDVLAGQTPGAPTGPPLHPSEAVPSTVSPPVETPVPGPSGGAPSPESVVPPAAPPAEVVQGLHFNGNAGTAWQSMSEAGIPPSDIMTKLENALNASGVDFVKHVDAADGTNTWFEIIYPDGSRASDTASIMQVAAPYIAL